MFYLNYEGCKREICLIRPYQLYRFYLNYEGCKQMGELANFLKTNKFYLNYEGCKLLNNIFKIHAGAVLSEL